MVHIKKEKIGETDESMFTFKHRIVREILTENLYIRRNDLRHMFLDITDKYNCHCSFDYSFTSKGIGTLSLVMSKGGKHAYLFLEKNRKEATKELKKLQKINLSILKKERIKNIKGDIKDKRMQLIDLKKEITKELRNIKRIS